MKTEYLGSDNIRKHNGYSKLCNGSGNELLIHANESLGRMIRA